MPTRWVPLLTIDLNSFTGLTPSENLTMIIHSSLQLYADFAGYSAMAVGVSLWFGLPATMNFRQPYFATSLETFWRSWHISLSNWFRDYLFYPLSRFLVKHIRWKRLAEVISYLVTMIAVGLWHGITWPFTVWGLLHGIYIIVERLVKRVAGRSASNRRAVWQIVIGFVLTQSFVTMAWVFFRTSAIADTLYILRRIPSADLSIPSWWIRLLTPVCLLLIVDIPLAFAQHPSKLWHWRPLWLAVTATMMLLGLFLAKTSSPSTFVYFGF